MYRYIYLLTWFAGHDPLTWVMGPCICGRLITKGNAFLGIVFDEKAKHKINIKITLIWFQRYR